MCDTDDDDKVKSDDVDDNDDVDDDKVKSDGVDDNDDVDDNECATTVLMIRKC